MRRSLSFILVVVSGCYVVPLRERADDDSLSLDETMRQAGESPLMAQAPPSPSRERRPVITGSTRPGEPVGVYFAFDCSGDPVVTGTADESGAFSFAVDVAANVPTALAVSDGVKCVQLGNYVHDDLPPNGTLQASAVGVDVTLTVATEQSASVELFDAEGCTGTPVAATFAVAPNASYVFSARIVDLAGNVSCIQTTFQHDDIPPLVSAPTVAVDIDNDVSLAWTSSDAGSGVFTHRVCRSTDPRAACSEVSETSQTMTELLGSAENERQYFAIEAVDGAGNEARSPLSSVRTLTRRHNVAQLSLGETHACARLGDGSIQCWGDARNGRLGNGIAADTRSSVPQNVGGGYTDVCVGVAHSCAVRTNGDVHCWGSNSVGQLAQAPPSTHSPTPVLAASRVKAVACGGNSVCGVTTTGGVLCWGSNTKNNLGRGASPGTTSTPAPVLTAEGVELADVVQVAGGLDHYCALRGDGTIACWGANESGQLGRNTATTSEALANVAVVTNAGGTLLTGAVQVATGYNHSCARLAGGDIRCWGDASSLQISSPNTTDRLRADSTLALDPAVFVAAGGASSCAVIGDGRALCWGSDAFSQLANSASNGVSTATPRLLERLPEDVAFEDVASVHVGLLNVCVLLVDGDALCWGNNFDSLIVADAAFSETHQATLRTWNPTRVGTREVALGAQHACALLYDGTAYCWGAGDPLPLRVEAPPIRHITAGNAHTCYLRGDGNIGCFGDNSHGQLGSLAVADKYREVAAGGDNTCGIRADLGQVFCWGKGADGMLGNDTTADSTAPVNVENQLGAVITGFSRLRLGVRHACGLLSTGRATCWGNNADSQLGRAGSGLHADTTNANMLPPDPTPSEHVIDLAIGRAHTCALLTNGLVACVGLNDVSQFGDNTTSTTPTTTLTTVERSDGSPMSDAIAVAAGLDSTLALRRNNTPVRGWGQNAVGQNSNPFAAVNDAAAQYVDATGNEIEEIVAMDVGDDFSCVVTINGDVHCAGQNGQGQTGQAVGGNVATAARAPHLP